jgi:hypothetical protein
MNSARGFLLRAAWRVLTEKSSHRSPHAEYLEMPLFDTNQEGGYYDYENGAVF